MRLDVINEIDRKYKELQLGIIMDTSKWLDTKTTEMKDLENE